MILAHHNIACILEFCKGNFLCKFVKLDIAAE